MAKVDSKGKVTVEKGDTPSKIAKDLGISVAQVNAAIKANPTLAARQQAGGTVLFSGTTFKVPGFGAAPTTNTPTTTPVVDVQAQIDAALRAQATAAQAARTAENRASAYDFIRSRAEELGIGVAIANRIIDLVADKGLSLQAIDLEIQTTPEYKARFAGIEKYKQNFASDIAAGKKAAQPTPAEYIAYEKQAQNVLNRFGLADLANQETYADLIGGDVSITEVTERITDVYDRIQNADDVLKTQLSTYFPTYGTSDFARALLTGKTPQDMASQLKRRLTTAEIASEATRAGLMTNAERAQQLEQMGVSRNLARAGFSKIAEQQPVLEKLGNIYGEQVSQEELEAEQFQGLASARRKRLEATERASFTGRAGTSQVSLTQGTAGAI
jgi:hypothetical protein